MAHTFYMKRDKSRPVFVPVNQAEAQAFDDAIPVGPVLKVTTTVPRSIKQNNTYWGLLAWVIENGPEWIGKKWQTAQAFSDAMQLHLGYVRHVALFNGEVRAFPESKSFEEMTQARFSEYFNKVQIELNEMCGYEPLPMYLNRRAA